jgi:hypothetical protein
MEGDDLIERRSEDVTPVLENVKALRSIGEVGSSEMRHAARFPRAVVEIYMAKQGVTLHDMMTDPKHFDSMLRDPDLSEFRVWKGRV